MVAEAPLPGIKRPCAYRHLCPDAGMAPSADWAAQCRVEIEQLLPLDPPIQGVVCSGEVMPRTIHRDRVIDDRPQCRREPRPGFEIAKPSDAIAGNHVAQIGQIACKDRDPSRH